MAAMKSFLRQDIAWHAGWSFINLCALFGMLFTGDVFAASFGALGAIVHTISAARAAAELYAL